MIQLKKHLLLFLLFNFTLCAQVTITNSNLKIDNTPITNSTINFSNTSNVSLSLNIQLLTSDGSSDNTFGNLFLFFKPSPNDSPTQVGFQSITFVNNFPKTDYISQVSFNNIILYKNNFFPTGGIFYVQYKNNKNKTYNSTNIPITGGIKTSNPKPKPPTIEQPNFVLGEPYYTDNLPIQNSKIIIPNNSSRLINLKLGYDFSKHEYTEIEVYLSRKANSSASGGDGDIISLKKFTVNKNSSHTTLLNDVEITPEMIDRSKYYYELKAYLTSYSPDNQTLTYGSKKVNSFINIEIAKPILYNTISDNQSLMLGQLSKPFTTATPSVDFTIPCNRRGCVTIYDYRDVTTFQWQIRTQNTDWIDIQGQTLKDFSPNKTFTENTYYRRIAFYNDGQYDLSNTISISLNNQGFENTVCCNQTLPLTTSQPQEISGNTPELSNFTYQWQICKDPNASSPEWTDLPNTTNKNLKYTFPEAARRGSEITGFRRLIKINSLVTSTSNSINITRKNGSTGLTPGRRSLILESNNEASKETTNNIHLQDIENTTYTTETNLSLYPNPIINNFYIQNTNKFRNTEKIKLYDASGNEVKINKTKISDNLIEVNMHSASPGIYVVHINEDTLITKKIIKN